MINTATNFGTQLDLVPFHSAKYLKFVSVQYRSYLIVTKFLLFFARLGREPEMFLLFTFILLHFTAELFITIYYVSSFPKCAKSHSNLGSHDLIASGAVLDQGPILQNFYVRDLRILVVS
jgi:hypothetical protein